MVLVSGDAIKCYKCTNPPTPECGAEFDKDGVEAMSGECDSLVTRCAKYVFSMANYHICSFE